MDARYSLQARDKPGLLVAVMRLLAGDARISFEGDLSRASTLRSLPGASGEETSVLRRNTAFPVQDFVVVPLDAANLPILITEVSAPGRLTSDVLHVQIEKGEQLQFGAYDNFHPDCIVVSSGVPLAVLEELQRKGVLRSFQEATSQSEVKP
jgi:hypothetical protein